MPESEDVVEAMSARRINVIGGGLVSQYKLDVSFVRPRLIESRCLGERCG